jgi:carbon-monoxide dehydrogenase small subunit
VLIEGLSVDSCLVLAAEVDGQEVTTVEGLATPSGLSPVQQAFLDTGAAQCGFCIPGQVVSAHALLATTPHPSRADVEEGLAGNLCRCAGYEQIIEAVLLAADAQGTRRDAPAAPPVDMASRPDAREAPQ